MICDLWDAGLKDSCKTCPLKCVNNENPNLAFLCMILPLDNSVIFIKLSSTINALEILEKEFDVFCSSFRKR